MCWLMQPLTEVKVLTAVDSPAFLLNGSPRWGCAARFDMDMPVCCPPRRFEIHKP